MNNSQFSILMSIYVKDVPSHFDMAMRSIWDEQTLKPNEIVLVEDGVLTDELYAGITKWHEKLGDVLKIVKLKRNLGLAAALNEGIKHCSHDLIARMDADDISDPYRFEKQIEYLQSHKDVHVLGGAIQEFSDQENKILATRSYPCNTTEAKKYMAKASPLAHPSVIYRKELFTNGLFYSDQLKTSQDIDLWYRVINAGYNIASIRDVVYYFRVSGNFFKRRSREKAYDEFGIYWNGILSIHGFSWRLVFPVLRLTTRLMPIFLIKLFYSKHFRELLNIKDINKSSKSKTSSGPRMKILDFSDNNIMNNSRILNINFDFIDHKSVLTNILEWKKLKKNSFITLTNPYSVLLCHRDEKMMQATQNADLTLPDGTGIIWAANILGHKHHGRVAGPDLMLHLCDWGCQKGLRHFFYGGAEGVADKLAQRLTEMYPGLDVAGTYCPPFSQLSDQEDEDVIRLINASNADIVWVGLGAPKQEIWMLNHLSKVNVTAMIGVGAAFNFHSGIVKRAPVFIRKWGLEWLWRFTRNPRRMWRRDLDSLVFLTKVIIQKIKSIADS